MPPARFGKSAVLHMRLPAHLIATFKARARTSGMSMTRYFKKVLMGGAVDPTTKKPALPSVFPGMLVELAQGPVAYVLDRDVDSGVTWVVLRSRDRWNVIPLPIHRRDVLRFLEAGDRLLRGVRKPKADLVVKLKMLCDHAAPNVSGLKKMSDKEELTFSPDERRRKGLCMACGDKIDTGRKKRGFFVCGRCSRTRG